ncbi:RDD family protein [Hymenobacter sp.]|jgi:uncharacterized RDD family membrane protein YckC|uniref:RDD family protein n=1 Tax=Hymenobacter sp. TaxID=1898978 RepID=UPI002ED87786
MQQDYSDQDYSEEHVENPSVFAELLNSPLAMTPASKGQRFANYLIDLVTFYALIFGLALGLGVLVAFTGNGEMVKWLDSPWATLVFVLIMLSYYFVLESTTGRTMGKLITRTRVVMEDGSKLTANAVLKRTLSRIIPYDAFSFLGSGSGRHDRIAKTRVVKVD